MPFLKKKETLCIFSILFFSRRREQERRGTTERTDRNKDRDLRSTDDRRNSLKSSSKFRESSRKHDTESRSKRRSPRPMRIKKVAYFDTLTNIANFEALFLSFFFSSGKSYR